MTLLEAVTAKRKANPGSWSLAGILSTAFGSQPQFARRWPVARMPTLRVVMLLSLLVSDRRVHRSGRAVCLLSRLTWRVLARMLLATLAISAATLALSLVSPWLTLILVLVLIWTFGPLGVYGLWAIPSRRQLHRWAPEPGARYVHSVASVLRGAGAEMLESLTAEADLKAWTLFLDTSNEALVRYYEQFGFMPASAPVLLPCGERSVRMLRRPSGATVGNLG